MKIIKDFYNESNLKSGNDKDEESQMDFTINTEF